MRTYLHRVVEENFLDFQSVEIRIAESHLVKNIQLHTSHLDQQQFL